MRFKSVPAVPEDSRPIEAIEAVHAALPRVPRPTGDCCARIDDRIGWVADREHAREWLGFLRALGVVRDAGSGVAPVRPFPDRASTAERFESNVLGAAEVLDTLADGPVTADAAFESVRPIVPPWERRRSPSWEASWREHTRRVLLWAAAFELAERSNDAGESARFRRP